MSPPASTKLYCFHVPKSKKKILCFRNQAVGFFLLIASVFWYTFAILHRFCSKENQNQWNCVSEFFMIVSSVLVCQRTPQDTRLIIMCSPFVTRSVLLILSLSASLGVSDNLLRRKPLICSELVYSAKKYLCRKAY